MITLYQFHPAFGLPNASPFCMKVETYLRMAALPYENVYTHDPRKAPKGKFPFIVDQGKQIADSAFILKYLQATYSIDLDTQLTAAEKAMGHALTVMLEEHLYWAVAYSRWLDERYWPYVREQYFAAMPSLARHIVPNLIRNTIRRDLKGQGFGRHSREEIYQLAAQDLAALAQFMAGKDFVMGNKISSVDAGVYAFLANILQVPLDTPIKRSGLQYPHLLQYCERMGQLYFSKE